MPVVAPSPVASTPSGLKDLFGRGMNNRSDVYKLPADQVEMNRLELQHRMWVLMEGGLYPRELSSTVRHVLAPTAERRAAILDVGSGSGIWAVEMAVEFPDAEIIGLDLAERHSRRIAGKSSLMLRFLETHASPRFEAADCTDDISNLPCGLFILADGHFLFDEHKSKLGPATAGIASRGECWFATWMLETKARMGSKSQHNFPGETLLRWIEEDGCLEKQDGVEYFCPINWDGDGMENGKELGKIMWKNIQEYIAASTPALLAHGLAHDVAETWTRNIERELEGPKIRIYLKWCAAWGIRRTE
ncbi:hypothetical protein BD410DRAFT_803254 [Rickenella mellea]|uniref:S-adenosyl-L-methionine-dependent methyltransferase n=1 Tax=Rickenella mellea TaxID=50990 RepID=A0A4Y7Q5B2_9AGAM|nr:hypothetical protein BD410DRAFT_803254 [Rickenella mellea]